MINTSSSSKSKFHFRFGLVRVSAPILIILLAAVAPAQQVPDGDLSLTARASASSEAEGTKAENLTDGNISNTQWTAKEGTSPADTWVELNWPKVVQFLEVVIRQEGSQKLSHLKLETRDASGQWHRLQSIGDSQHLLPRSILVQFAAQNTNGLRLSDFAGQVSLTEVEVYNRTDPPVVVIGSDLLNHIFGIVTDAFGTQPFVHAAVQLRGAAGGKPWEVNAETDENGLFQVEMPVGLDGEVTAAAKLPSGDSPRQTVQAGDLTPGLSLPDDSVSALDLDGVWRFKPDPTPGFYKTDFSDADWKDIKVPSHWIMAGFNSNTGTGGYRRHVQIPANFRGRRIKLVFDGVYSGAEVWLNGERVGSHEGGFSPFELDVTRAAHVGGDNLLALLVREQTLSSHLDNMSYYANFPLTGIFRPVRLFSLPETHVRRFHVQTVFDSYYRNATLSVDLTMENESPHEISGARARVSAEGPAGSPGFTGQRSSRPVKLAPWSRFEKVIDFQVAGPNIGKPSIPCFTP